MVNKIVSRLKLGFLHPPSLSYPRAGPPQLWDLAVGRLGLQSNTQTAPGRVPGLLTLSGEQERKIEEGFRME